MDNKLSTDEMEIKIINAKNINEILNEEFDSNAFPEYFNKLLDKYKTNPHRLGFVVLSKSYISKLAKYDVEVHPTKNAILKIALALKANLDETQQLLKLSGNQLLYPKNKRDSIIMWAITHNISFMDTDEMLMSNGEKRLQDGD